MREGEEEGREGRRNEVSFSSLRTTLGTRPGRRKQKVSMPSKPGNTGRSKRRSPSLALSKARIKRLREHVQRLVGLLLPRLGDRAPRPGAHFINLGRVDPGELDDDGGDVVRRGPVAIDQ